MQTHKTPTLELASILEKYLPAYQNLYKISPFHQKILEAIIHCRTQEMGVHSTKCLNCGAVDIQYNSCRNRHCPKCQQHQKHKWLEERKKELLPIHYFHLVFTVPHELNSFFITNKALCYQLLFNSVWQTIKEFGDNPSWLGAQTGGLALLHTWGQNLSYHPHIHFIMPSGGLTDDKFEWISTHRKFFAPVWAMARRFRQLFLEGLWMQRSKLKPSLFNQELEPIIKSLENKNWIVFAQTSFADANCVMDYLGNYTHKIAISNYRLLKIENHRVFFSYKDYKDKGTIKVMSLPVFEFIRRFLDHILPPNFYKIRYFGILSNRYKADNIDHAREALKREGKYLKLKNKQPQKEDNPDHVPAGCTNTGACKTCGGPTISLERFIRLNLHIKQREVIKAI